MAKLVHALAALLREHHQCVVDEDKAGVRRARACCEHVMRTCIPGGDEQAPGTRIDYAVSTSKKKKKKKKIILETDFGEETYTVVVSADLETGYKVEVRGEAGCVKTDSGAAYMTYACMGYARVAFEQIMKKEVPQECIMWCLEEKKNECL